MASTRPTSPHNPQAALRYPRKTVVFCALMAYVLLVALSGVLNAPLPAAAADAHESSGSEASVSEKKPAQDPYLKNGGGYSYTTGANTKNFENKISSHKWVNCA